MCPFEFTSDRGVDLNVLSRDCILRDGNFQDGKSIIFIKILSLGRDLPFFGETMPGGLGVCETKRFVGLVEGSLDFDDFTGVSAEGFHGEFNLPWDDKQGNVVQPFRWRKWNGWKLMRFVKTKTMA